MTEPNLDAQSAAHPFLGAHAVVTGGGSGIGRGIALALARRGVDVVVSDIDARHGTRVAAEVEALGRRAVFVPADVSRLPDVEHLAEAAYAAFGSVEILVNNAGVALRPFRASWNTSREDFQWVIGTNLWGVLHGHIAFVPRMLEAAGFRHILNTSSMSNVIDSAGASAYAASKGAVTSFSIAAAAELAPEGIGLTILMPGYVTTSLAVSERLRPDAERSSARTVTPYESPLTNLLDGANGPSRAGRPPTSELGLSTPLDPLEAGEMAARAIAANQLFCLTHVPPQDEMRARTEQMIQSYQPFGQHRDEG